MTSPLMLRLMHSAAGQQAHEVLELPAYFVGARLYWRSAMRTVLQPPPVDRMLLAAGALFGAFIGSKSLHVAQHLSTLLAQHNIELWLGGKSILGGFIGGTLAVEAIKLAIGWRHSTGDAWVLPLAVGLVIGRLGCQLAGPWDQTYGTPTQLPWAWDYGDGIGRHPTALYEMLLVVIAVLIARRPGVRQVHGASFALFLSLYCAIRLGLEFLKPPFGPVMEHSLPADLHFGLTAIQWAALSGMAGYGLLLKQRLHQAQRPALTNIHA